MSDISRVQSISNFPADRLSFRDLIEIYGYFLVTNGPDDIRTRIALDEALYEIGCRRDLVPLLDGAIDETKAIKDGISTAIEIAIDQFSTTKKEIFATLDEAIDDMNIAKDHFVEI